MKKVAILSRKGGTGKTTIATNLAVAGEEGGHPTVLIDVDPQSSSAKWGDTRNTDSPVIISTHSERLPKMLQLAEENGATFAIIDTAPHPESSALDAARAADLALILCKPDLISLRAIGSTVDLVRLAKVPGLIVFNGVPSHGDHIQQAKEAVDIYDVPCAPCVIGHRIAFVHAYNTGLAVQEFDPSGKASREITTLYKYVSNEMGV